MRPSHHAWSRTAVAVAFASALLGAACNAIFGLDELREGSADSAASSASSARGAGGALAVTAATSGGSGGVGGRGGEGGAGGQDPVGCSDGTRELFVDVAMEPDIAGCSGGWSVPGVKTAGSMQPACNRNSGNDSTNPGGMGCSVADLCAIGWHVCADAAEVEARAQSGTCPADFNPAGQGLWVTRQGQSPMAPQTCTDSGVNNLVGCGLWLGDTPDASCAPLNRFLQQEPCNQAPPWSCGTSMQIGQETLVVTKAGADMGGVLCCRDP